MPAIIVLEDYHIGMKRYLAIVGSGALQNEAIDTNERVMRTCTYENPYARIPLP